VDLSACLCLHAEENALLEAGRDRIGETAILYCNTCPCLTCSVKIAQVGISEVVYNQGYLVDTQTAKIFAESGVRLRQFSPPREGLVDLSQGVVQETLPAASQQKHSVEHELRALAEVQQRALPYDHSIEPIDSYDAGDVGR
jgi:dCMP deaminase